jgi:hypothetical protein
MLETPKAKSTPASPPLSSKEAEGCNFDLDITMDNQQETKLLI